MERVRVLTREKSSVSLSSQPTRERTLSGGTPVRLQLPVRDRTLTHVPSLALARAPTERHACLEKFLTSDAGRKLLDQTSLKALPSGGGADAGVGGQDITDSDEEPDQIDIFLKRKASERSRVLKPDSAKRLRKAFDTMVAVGDRVKALVPDQDVSYLELAALGQAGLMQYLDSLEFFAGGEPLTE